MPITIQRKVVPIAAAAAAPATAAASNHEELRDFLAQRDIAWSQQMQHITQALHSTLQAIPAPQSPMSWTFQVHYRPNGAIDTISCTPMKTKT
jgi:hypothetical protein